MEKNNRVVNKHRIVKDEKKYHALFEQAPDAILRGAFEHSAIGMSLISLKGQWLKVNKKLCDITGYTEEQMLSLHFQDITHPDDLKKDIECYHLLLEGRIETYQTEKRYIHKKGNLVWVNINVSLVKDSDKKPLYFVAQTEDIHHKRNIELALAESETKFRILVEKSLAGVYIIQDKKFRYVNSLFAKTVGYTEKELLESDSVLTIIAEEDQKKVLENIRIMIDGEADNIQYEVRGQKKNGEKIWAEVFGNRIMYNGNPAIIGTLIDITQKKMMDQEILDRKVQEQKKITRAILNAQEKERNRIGQELHDNVNQILAGTKLYLIVAGREDKKLKKQLKHPISLIDSSISEIRLLSSKNVTPLKNINLKELVGRLLYDIQETTTIKTKFSYPAFDKPISDDLKLNIYRIIQEQAGNVIKHAKPKKFRININTNNNAININMADDGKGFDTRKKRKGIGISNMINRVESFNGRFLIESSPGKGCIVAVMIPY